MPTRLVDPTGMYAEQCQATKNYSRYAASEEYSAPHRMLKVRKTKGPWFACIPEIDIRLDKLYDTVPGIEPKDHVLQISSTFGDDAGFAAWVSGTVIMVGANGPRTYNFTAGPPDTLQRVSLYVQFEVQPKFKPGTPDPARTDWHGWARVTLGLILPTTCQYEGEFNTRLPFPSQPSAGGGSHVAYL
jgi:hypothetical protein